MKPYYDKGDIQIYLGDCRDVLPQLEPVDLCLTDPPYNISKTSAKISRGGGKFTEKTDISLDFGKWDYGEMKWQEYLPLINLTDVGVLAMFHEQLELGVIGTWLRDKKQYTIRHIGCWAKTNPAPQARKVKWQNGTEMFIVATKNSGVGHHFNYKLGQSPNYFLRSVNQPNKQHPTQKPLDLILWIAQYWSFKNDTILDPFMGVGTTLVAAQSLGRKVIGIEINKEYCDIAIQKLKQSYFPFGI